MLAVASPAFAQSGADDPNAANGDIIVTAQKRAQSVQNIPVAISALNSELLEQRGIATASDLQFAVPSMQVGNLLGATAVTIRGVGLNQGSPGVAIHVDGVYQPRPQMGDLLQIDLERVEVLRGPQGTLYGRNANGGVVNFITKAPTADYEGYMLAGYGNYDQQHVQGMVNLPFSDAVRARVVLDWSKRGDGFVKNVIPGGQDVDKGETFSGRVRFAFDLAHNLKLDLAANFLKGTGPTQYFVLHNQPTPISVALNPALGRATYSFKPWETTANDPINSDRRFLTTSATLAWELGDFSIKSISGFTKMRDDTMADDDGINVSIFPVRRFTESKSFSQELNVGASFEIADVVTGVYYLNDTMNHILDYNMLEGIAPGTPAGLPPGSHLTFRIPDYDTQVKAAFADVTLKPTDRLSLIAGIRFSEEKQNQLQRNNITIGAGGPEVLTCPTRANDAQFNSTTPRFGARYEFSRDVNAYATFSKGFKAGGFNLYACDNPFAPEKLTSYEGGLKTRLFDRALTLNLSGFYYDYTDLQISQVVGLARTITNAAAAEVKGAELELAWRPDNHWTLDGNLSYLDATYKRFSNTDGLAPQDGVQVLDGNRLNQAPTLSINAGVGYRTTPSDIGVLTFRTDVSQRSRTYFREFNGPLDKQDGFASVNASIVWVSPDERFRVRLYGTNLFNTAHIAQMDSSDNFGARFISWGAPRQYGAELRANF
jgi:iron complex outermembrane receptor protein